jgi:hypothetical protein
MAKARPKREPGAGVLLLLDKLGRGMEGIPRAGLAKGGGGGQPAGEGQVEEDVVFDGVGDVVAELEGLAWGEIAGDFAETDGDVARPGANELGLTLESEEEGFEEETDDLFGLEKGTGRGEGDGYVS